MVRLTWIRIVSANVLLSSMFAGCSTTLSRHEVELSSARRVFMPSARTETTLLDGQVIVARGSCVLCTTETLNGWLGKIMAFQWSTAGIDFEHGGGQSTTAFIPMRATDSVVEQQAWNGVARTVHLYRGDTVFVARATDIVRITPSAPGMWCVGTIEHGDSVKAFNGRVPFDQISFMRVGNISSVVENVLIGAVVVGLAVDAVLFFISGMQ
jgi:hypothetical protein